MKDLEPEKTSVDERTLRAIIDQLRRELEEVRYALWALESVAAGRPRRGRPPKWVAERKGRRRPGKASTKAVRSGRQVDNP